MATQTAVVGTWGCPTVEAGGRDGGFTYTYDDVTYPGGPPLDSSVTVAPSVLAFVASAAPAAAEPTKKSRRKKKA